MMDDIEMVILYAVVGLAIAGFVVAFGYIMGLQGKGGFEDVGSSETDTMFDDKGTMKVWCDLNEKGERGIGKAYPSGGYYKVADVPSCAIEYVSAYDPINVVKFNDPADAYEYVVKAVMNKNKALDRLESSVYLGDPMNYDYLLLDLHRERDYWLTELHEYREDA